MELKACPIQKITQIVKIHVYRNHSFEPVASVINPFLGYSGIQPQFSYSDYDDSFNFSNIPNDAEIILLWIDFEHYEKKIDISKLLRERLQFLREKSRADIVLVGLGGGALHQEDLNISGCYIADTGFFENQIGESLYDERFRSVTATRLSNTACLQMARWLGMSLLPSLLQPNLKAIILDLDNTLYSGVLGEDGADGIVLTEGHKWFQEKLKELKAKGFFLALVSKNEIKDVQEMFKMRNDFPLAWGDFSAVVVSWDSKASNIEKIAKILRIAPDSMLFVDDNIGEVISVGSSLSSIKIILADMIDPFNTVNALLFYPGIFKWRNTEDDAKRFADLQSNEARENLKQSVTQGEYIKQLNVQISYHVNQESNLSRIAELGGKTNQFILSYKRFKEQKIKELMRCDNWDVIDFSLKDNLSDSGLIGAVITQFSDDTLFVEDLFVSCRALGREIEDVLILKALDIIRKKYLHKEIMMNYKKGERNQPALEWLQKITKKKLKLEGSVALSSSLFDIKSEHVMISIEQ